MTAKVVSVYWLSVSTLQVSIRGKIAVEAHKLYRNTNYQKGSSSSTPSRKFGHAQVSNNQYCHTVISFIVAKPLKFLEGKEELERFLHRQGEGQSPTV